MTIQRTASTLACLLLAAACGPQVQVNDTSGGADSSSGTTVAATTSPLPLGTTAEPPPSSSTDGTLDTGETTDSQWLDFPENCRTIEQDCPPGYKCMPFANEWGSYWNDTMCVEIVDNPAGPGERCTVVDSGTSGFDDCDGSSMCWDVDPKTNEGRCQPFCVGSESEPSCAEPCDSCAIAVDGAITLCFSTCDPLDSDCAEGQGCYPGVNGFLCSPDASGVSGIGDACELINGCPSGSLCLNSDVIPGCDGSLGCCSPYCMVGADTCDRQLPGTICQPWYEEGEVPTSECASGELGVCILP